MAGQRHVPGPARRALLGGEFELCADGLAMAERSSRLPPAAAGTWTISGRGAFAVLLRQLMERGVTHVHLPAFLCESLLLPVKALGLGYSFYPLDAALAAHPDPPPGAAVLLIHYFGWLNPSAETLRAQAGSSFLLVEDYSQSLFSDPGMYRRENALLFFSARKFGPVPLGGWCSAVADLAESGAEADALFWRSLAARLLKGSYLGDRGGALVPAIEARYLRALSYVESSLDAGLLVSRLPDCACELLDAVDWDAAARRRRENWLRMREALAGSFDLVYRELPEETVPLGFVIRTGQRDELRSKLAESRMFCPVHWPLPPEVSARQFPLSGSLSKSILTIPIDQRYDGSDLDRVINILKRHS